MEIGFGELLLTGILAMVLLKPDDLPMAAKKAAKVYLGIQGFMKKNWLALAEGAEEKKAAALARTGLIHAETLRQGRRFAVLISFIVSALLTPPDVMSQVMMAIPSILLFECSIRCAAWAERSCKQETATLTVNG